MKKSHDDQVTIHKEPKLHNPCLLAAWPGVANVALEATTYLKDKLGARSMGQMQGDLLVVRSKFTIKRNDYGINPGAPSDKVADEIELTLSLAGAAPKS